MNELVCKVNACEIKKENEMLKNKIAELQLDNDSMYDRITEQEDKIEELNKLEQKNIEAIRTEAYNEGFRDGQKTMGDYYKKEIQKLICCGNCRNEKYLDRPYEYTICKDCKDHSNWEAKQ